MPAHSPASSGLPQAKAPTAFLPPLGKLSTISSTHIFESLKALRSLYFSHTQPIPAISSLPSAIKIALGLVQGSKEALGIQKRFNALTLRNVRSPISPSSTGYNTPVIDSGYASAYVSDDEEDGDCAESAASCCSLLCHLNLTDLETECKSLEALRADALERTFATRWVTGFISRAEAWVEEGTPDDNDGGEHDDSLEYTIRSALLEEALDILAAFTSVDEARDEEEDEDPSYLRTLTFPCPRQEGEDDGGTLTMQINDARINEDDHTSVGLQTWGSSIIFAERMCTTPSVYMPTDHLSLWPSTPHTNGKPLRILELGAGTGILSIVVEKLFQQGTYGLEVGREIVATDFHPEVLDNLRRNVDINFPSTLHASPPIDVQTLDWQRPSARAPFNEPFDLILAADVVYHPDHARWIKDCVENLLGPSGVFWMFIALRASGRHEGLDETVDEIFGQPVGEGEQVLDEEVPKRLAILKTERLGRKSSSVGRADECAYRLFKIGWVR